MLKDWKEETGHDVFTVPHHSSDNWLGWNYHYYDEEMVPLFEIFQVRGSSEMRTEQGNPLPFTSGYGEISEPGHTFQDALSMGYKIGAIASTDGHEGHPCYLPRRPSWLTESKAYRDQFIFSKLSGFGRTLSDAPYTGGMVGVKAKELTRDEVFKSLKDRKTIAVTAPDRILIDFNINGKEIGDGSVFEVDHPYSVRKISCSVYGTAPLLSVEVIKNNQTLYKMRGESSEEENLSNYHLDLLFEDSERITGVQWNDWRGTDGEDFYYVRVLQTNGGAAWLGPIWVKSIAEAKISTLLWQQIGVMIFIGVCVAAIILFCLYSIKKKRQNEK